MYRVHVKAVRSRSALSVAGKKSSDNKSDNKSDIQAEDNAEVFFYQPVCSQWQKFICDEFEFELVQENGVEHGSPALLLTSPQTRDTLGNGLCLYNALSHIITGSEVSKRRLYAYFEGRYLIFVNKVLLSSLNLRKYVNEKVCLSRPSAYTNYMKNFFLAMQF